MSEIQDVGIDALTEFALNMRWSWNRSTDELWAQFDPELGLDPQPVGRAADGFTPQGARPSGTRPAGGG